MIIDSHVHLVSDGWVSDSFLLGNARVAVASASKATGQGMDPAMLVQALKPVLADPTAEKLVAAMDQAGVGLSCICAIDYGLLTGEPGVSIEDQNRAIAKAVERFPDRLVGLFAIDPRREGALEMLRRGVEDWGLRGLKLHPTVGYYPYDDVCYPFYEYCQERKIPVLFHTGSQPAPAKSRFARPIYVDDVASDFPDLPIIMAHVGHNWYEEALLVCSVKPNVSVDVSGWQRAFMESSAAFYRVLRQVLDAVGPWRVFFGSDGPYLNVLFPLDQWTKAVGHPDLSGCPDVVFTREELDIVMGRAFARLMGLPGESQAAAGRQ